MARPGLTGHRKFRRLERAIGSAPLALGCLEFLWESCYQNGDDYLGESLDVEASARWDGEPGKLTAALLDAGGLGTAGFIEPHPDRPGAYRVHQLFEHAPEYVQKRMLREIARTARGETIQEVRRQAGKKGRAAQLARQTSASVGQVSDNCPANGDTPAPAPAPAPAPIPEEANASSPDRRSAPPAGAGEDRGKPAELVALWNAFAAKEGFPQVKDLGKERTTALRARLREPGWWDMLPDALRFLQGSKWHHENPVHANLGTMLRPGKVREYAEKAGARASPSGASHRAQADLAALKSKEVKHAPDAEPDPELESLLGLPAAVPSP